MTHIRPQVAIVKSIHIINKWHCLIYSELQYPLQPNLVCRYIKVSSACSANSLDIIKIKVAILLRARLQASNFQQQKEIWKIKKRFLPVPHLLKCWTFCNKTWYGGASLCVRMLCENSFECCGQGEGYSKGSNSPCFSIQFGHSNNNFRALTTMLQLTHENSDMQTLNITFWVSCISLHSIAGRLILYSLVAGQQALIW